MRYVFFDDFQPGVLRDGRVYSLAPLLADAGAHTPQETLEYLIADERRLLDLGRAEDRAVDQRIDRFALQPLLVEDLDPAVADLDHAVERGE